MALTRPGGTYVTLQEPAPADRVAELGITGTFFVVTPGHESLRQLGSEVDSGQLRVTVASTYPLAEGRAAFESGALPGRARARPCWSSGTATRAPISLTDSRTSCSHATTSSGRSSRPCTAATSTGSGRP